MTGSTLVVIPVYRPVMTDLERFSLERCVSMLGSYPIALMGPESLDTSIFLACIPGAREFRFPDRFFRSPETYSELLLHDAFYAAFREFEFILIHQLDAYVFEDQLVEWCQTEWDYIGAPFVHSDGRWRGVGNGGFSLRRVEAHRRVLTSRGRISGAGYWEHVIAQNSPLQSLMFWPRRIMYQANVLNDLPSILRHWVSQGQPEDIFWGILARHALPEFRVPAPETALSFAVECGIEQARNSLKRPPFGAHQWWLVGMLRRLVEGNFDPVDRCERMIWEIGCLAGLGEYGKLRQPLNPGPCRRLCRNWPEWRLIPAMSGTYE